MTVTANNLGNHFIARREAIKKSTSCPFSIKPLFDLATSPNVLVPGLELKLTFEKNRAAIPLMCPDNNKNYKIRFTDVTLTCRRHTIPDPSSPFMTSINERKLHYPINRCVTRMRQIREGFAKHTISHISNGQTPYHIFCALVSDDQLTNINSNPILLGTHGLKSFQLTKNSKQYPKRELEVSGAGVNKIRTYKYFLEQVNSSEYIQLK